MEFWLSQKRIKGENDSAGDLVFLENANNTNHPESQVKYLENCNAVLSSIICTTHTCNLSQNSVNISDFDAFVNSTELHKDSTYNVSDVFQSLSELQTYNLSCINHAFGATGNSILPVFNSTLPASYSRYSVSLSAGQWLRVSAYVAIFFLGVVGNSLVVATLLYHRNMRTITNIFLLNLAVSDLLLGVFCMPFTLVGSLLRDFIFGAAMCKLIPYMQAVSVSVSVWTLVAISLERFFAICRPLTSRQWQTIKHAFQVVAVVWVSSLILMLPIAILSELVPFGEETGHTRHKCRERWPSITSEKTFSLLLSSFLLLVPLIIMVVAYMRVVRCLSKGMNMEKRQVLAYSDNDNTLNNSLMRKGSQLSRISVRFKKFPKNRIYGADAESEFEKADGCCTLQVKDEMPRSKSYTIDPSDISLADSDEKAKEYADILSTVDEDSEKENATWFRLSSLKRLKSSFVAGHRRQGSEASFNGKNVCQVPGDQSFDAEDGDSCSDRSGRNSRRKTNSSDTGEMRHHLRPLRSTHLRQSLVAKQRVVRMLFVLVAEFFICWTPLYVVNNLAFWIPEQVYAALGNVGISLIQLLAYASSCCNPITYCFMNATFFQSFKQAFSCTQRRAATTQRSFMAHPAFQCSLKENSSLVRNNTAKQQQNNLLPNNVYRKNAVSSVR